VGTQTPSYHDAAVRVLLIEDDEDLAEMYRLRLAADGYAVVIAPDGEDGVAAARSQAPDLIFLDVRLPRLDGVQVLERLRASPEACEIPVIVLTSYGEPEIRSRCLGLGALDYLVKADVIPSALSDRVRQVTHPAA